MTRHTQPMNAEEQRIDVICREQHRSHAAQDQALNLYRLAQRTSGSKRAEFLERVADIAVGERL